MTQCQAPVNHYLSLCLVARCGPLWQRFALLHAIFLHCFRACESTLSFNRSTVLRDGRPKIGMTATPSRNRNRKHPAGTGP